MHSWPILATRTPVLGRQTLTSGFPTSTLLTFFKKYFINLFERERESTRHEGWGAEGEGEADCPLSREPKAGVGSQGPGIMTGAKGRHLTT